MKADDRSAGCLMVQFAIAS